MIAYYNEIEPYAVRWLENLIAAGCVAPGVVEPRSIREVTGATLATHTQCHFFAGVAGWSYALRLAGWPDDEPVWTGSCPCQPFSVAGRQRGIADDRHLWPEWFRLIRECRPSICFGEQVASPAGLDWFDAVSADLEGEGYAVGAADLCAAGVGAPHLRQRLFFVAVQEGGGSDRSATGARDGPTNDRVLGDANGSRVWRDAGAVSIEEDKGGRERRSPRDLADVAIAPSTVDGGRPLRIERPAAREAGVVRGRWGDADLVWCRDGKHRPAGAGILPLAHGVRGRLAVVRPGEQPGTSPPETHWYSRVGAIQGLGNAIVPDVAATFVRAVMDILGMEA